MPSLTGRISSLLNSRLSFGRSNDKSSRFTAWMGGASSYPASRVVDTVQGKVQGRKLVFKGEKCVDAFQGIPFAKPPIGQLRFKKPQPPDSWEGVRDATKFGARAIQPPLFFFEKFRRSTPSEDCLYLNVFTPCWEPPTEGFPVMVFIHGGGFVLGDAETYGDIGMCENLCTRDIIIVTIHYRLAYLGLFTTGDSVCPGNLALWDQTEALKWVQSNIRAFGGNKDNVTVFGQSAGGASVDFLHLSPHSTGLFHKGICLAGNTEAPWALASNMVEQCRKKAKLLGIEETDSHKLIDRLREVPAEKFGVNMMTQSDKEDHIDLETTPYIDGDFFPESLDELRKKATPKPLMTGVTAEEGIFFMVGKKNNDEGLRKFVSHVLRDADNKERLEEQLRKKYVDDRNLKDKNNLLRVQAEVHSDYFMNIPTMKWCKKNAANEQPVYLYLFEHFNVKTLGLGRFVLPILDATHCLELTYLFRKSIFAPFVSTESEHAVENNFSIAFTNFARFGNPNGGNTSRTDLPALWKPIDIRNTTRNFVFTTDGGHMSENYFGGRPADVHAMIESSR